MNRKILREVSCVILMLGVLVACSDSANTQELALDSDPAAGEEVAPPNPEVQALGDTSEADAAGDTAAVETPTDGLGVSSTGGFSSPIGGTMDDAEASQPSMSGLFAYIMPENSLKFMWVFTDHLIVHDVPSETGANLGRLRWGKKVAVLAEQEHWIKIAEGAWAGREHLTDRKSRWLGRDGKQAHGDFPVASWRNGGDAFRVSAFLLNVRDQPGKVGKVLGQLSHGMLVRGKETDNGWIEIGPGQFVSSNWLSRGAGAVAH